MIRPSWYYSVFYLDRVHGVCSMAAAGNDIGMPVSVIDGWRRFATPSLRFTLNLSRNL